MSMSAVLPIWQAARERFLKLVKALPEQDLQLQTGNSSVESLIRHNAEVEYMFAEWFFGKKMPDEVKAAMSGDADESKVSPVQLEELVQLLEASNTNLIEAMQSLSDDAWYESVESSFGTSTPLEAIGRLIYHTGIHAGQISFIQKSGRSQ
ncbi:DinB family protein [Paenibacillus sp. CMAA1364]